MTVATAVTPVVLTEHQSQNACRVGLNPIPHTLFFVRARGVEEGETELEFEEVDMITLEELTDEDGEGDGDDDGEGDETGATYGYALV